jgi:CBS domain-containing protein
MLINLFVKQLPNCKLFTAKSNRVNVRKPAIEQAWFQAILKVLIPEISGSLSQKLQAIGVSIAFAEGDTPHLDESNQKFRERVIKNAETKVSDIMLKLRGKNATIDMTLVDALKIMYRSKITILPVYENDKLIGILRDSDLFLATASILTV